MDLCQWFTPPAVATAFLKWADLPEDDLILNPSAGEGALVPDRPNVLAVEIDSNLISNLKYWRPKAHIICTNFLEIEPQPVKMTVLNPPYAHDNEGIFIRQSLMWAPRVCALVRTLALHGKKRFQLCWRYVQPVRIAILVHRPRFLSPGWAPTKYNPEADYMAIECIKRPEPLPLDMSANWVAPLHLQWVNWR